MENIKKFKGWEERMDYFRELHKHKLVSGGISSLGSEDTTYCLECDQYVYKDKCAQGNSMETTNKFFNELQKQWTSA